MHRDGWPNLFWGQHDIYGRFESWPVCTRRVRCRQTYYDYAKTKTWGSVPFDASAFGEYYIRHVPACDDTHVLDRRLFEWFIDSDQHDDRVTELPVNWVALISRVDEFIRRMHLPVYCLKCNRTHAYRDLYKQDDNIRPGSCYKRLICPEAHILFKYESIHTCPSPFMGRDRFKRAGRVFVQEYGNPSGNSWWFDEEIGDIRFDRFWKASMGLSPDKVCFEETQEEIGQSRSDFHKPLTCESDSALVS